MVEELLIQGRNITHEDIILIKELIRNNPEWHRTRLSKELCKIWDWRRLNGDLKDMSCRTLLLKLQRKGYLQLPLPRKSANNHIRNRTIKKITIQEKQFTADLKKVTPITIRPIKDKNEDTLFRSILEYYHYLGYKGTVGENIKYIVYDSNNRILSVLLFGASAWSIDSRDKYIGWDTQHRKNNLIYIANNMRFLILPWIKIENLATHIIGKIIRRISDDWVKKYSHSLYMLETFVEIDRFLGTCYKASNWIYVGNTKGRTRNDRYTSIKAPVKAIYLYPLVSNFRKKLNN